MNHNAFVADLEDQGYHCDLVGAHFVIYGLPYLDESGDLRYGDWFSSLDLNGCIIDPPTNNHQALFRGSRPCNVYGKHLNLGGGAQSITISDELVADQSFSFKLLDEAGRMRDYVSFEEKVRTYLDAIIAPAMAEFPEAHPLRGIEVKAAQQGSALRIPDSMSARYHINDVAHLLRGKSVAIVGLGGTGAYVLDFLAKTHLDRIALFDSDKVHVHTIFRIPGFIDSCCGRQKVNALAEQYSKMHSGIEPHDHLITSENMSALDEFDFVFVTVDDAKARGVIVRHLVDQEIPFVDCGMGLTRSVVGLNGMVRVTGTDREAYDAVVDTAYLPTHDVADDEYRRIPQIAELNALNAALAVIRFKQHFKFYDLLDTFPAMIFETCTLEIDRSGV